MPRCLAWDVNTFLLSPIQGQRCQHACAIIKAANKLTRKVSLQEWRGQAEPHSQPRIIFIKHLMSEGEVGTNTYLEELHRRMPVTLRPYMMDAGTTWWQKLKYTCAMKYMLLCILSISVGVEDMHNHFANLYPEHVLSLSRPDYKGIIYKRGFVHNSEGPKMQYSSSVVNGRECHGVDVSNIHLQKQYWIQSLLYLLARWKR